jgi:hypothetical protein
MVSDDEAADLRAGLWYVNISTDACPHGEIRGQSRARRIDSPPSP